jgi:hypothetical protein
VGLIGEMELVGGERVPAAEGFGELLSSIALPPLLSLERSGFGRAEPRRFWFGIKSGVELGRERGKVRTWKGDEWKRSRAKTFLGL